MRGSTTSRLPSGPVLGWSSFAGARLAGEPGVLQLSHQVLVTSGRAALYQALCQLRLAPGSVVLVPSYHCPTMIAPVLCAGLAPVYYGIGKDGLPLPDSVRHAAGRNPRAMIVAHLFGLPRSLQAIRRSCDEHGIALIEDCAHALFGMAGERPVGAWGDYATASLTKFLPMAELGLLASEAHALAVILERAPYRRQLKAGIDILEKAAGAGRPAGLATALRVGFALKNKLARRSASNPSEQSPIDPEHERDRTAALLSASDMGRIAMQPAWANRALLRSLPLRRMARLRRSNYDRLAVALHDAPNSWSPFPSRPPSAVPYAFQLWVADADRVYVRLRSEGWPVYRWDRVWPGVQSIGGDVGADWSQRMLQLLCHQDLSSRNIEDMAEAVRKAVK